jgi:futalosine hydrolase
MLLLIAASPVETRILRRHLAEPRSLEFSRHRILSAGLCGQEVILAHCGIGQVNMALQLTRLLSRFDPEAVLLFGCGGSYPDSGLAIGDLALARQESYGDLGVQTGTEFVPLDDLKLPEDAAFAPSVRQTLFLDDTLYHWAQRLLPDCTGGAFVTVNCCSGTPAYSQALQQRWGGICENMEGAAAAQVCAEFEVPLLELRGISNPTGTREASQWNIAAGSAAAEHGILELLKHDLPQRIES